MEAFEIVITGDPKAAKSQAQKILADKGFQVDWQNEWSASAEKGSKAKNVLLGGFAQHMKVDVHITSGTDGQSVVRFDRGNIGVMGGALGIHKVNKNMQQLRDEYSAAAQQTGLFVGVREQ